MTQPPLNTTSSLSPSQTEIEAVLRLIVPHPLLLDAHKKVRQALMLPEGYGILLVVGPPGVGKSALASACRLADLSNPEAPDPLSPGSSPGSIPLVSVAARTGTTFLSRWKNLLLDILKITNPPLADAQGAGSSSSAPVPSGRGFETFSIPRLESAVIESLRYRKTVGVLVDEAQDLAPFGSDVDSIQLAKSLKHLGSAAESVLVLFGSYSLLSFLDLSAQLSRRCTVVHLPRYDVNKPADSANFQRVLSTFCEVAPTLLPYAQLSLEFPLLYTGSAGGTGNLRLWLVRAAGNAISAGAPCVTAAHLRAEIMADATIRQVLGAAQSGEALFGKLYSALDATIASVFTGVPFATSSSSRPSGSRYHPGKRNPQRDSTAAVA